MGKNDIGIMKEGILLVTEVDGKDFPRNSKINKVLLTMISTGLVDIKKRGELNRPALDVFTTE